MKITPAIFEAFLKCPTKCFLRAGGEVGAGNLYADWVRSQNESYREAGTKRLVANIPPDECAPPSTEPPNLKAAKWHLAVDLPAASQNLESRLHAVERVPSEGHGKPAQFIPIRFVFTNKLTRDDKLLLAFDAFVLSEMLGREANLGKIIHGDDHATLKVKTSTLTGEVRKLIGKMDALFSISSPPDLALVRHCAECEFQTRCKQKAIEKDDLSLLSRMSAKERKKLNNKGIFTVTQLSYTFRPRRRPKRLRDKREKYHHSLKALAIREKRIHIVGSPELKIEGTPVYLDVEGLPDRDFYYLIGVRIGNGESAVQHSLWADTIEDEERIWRALIALLLGVHNPVLVHYGSYEINVLKDLRRRYGEPAPESVAKKAFSCPINLLSTIYDQVYFPTFSNGLKEIAACLGFQRVPSIASGIVSIVWRRSWEISRDSKAKEKLIAYNTDDCKALQLATKTIMQIGGSVPGAVIPVVHTSSLKLQTASKWGALVSPIQEFESISRAAHWNYQRDRVRIRHEDRSAERVKPKRQICQRIGKSVIHGFMRDCPRCGNIEIGEPAASSRYFEDIIFGRFSMKRRLCTHEFSTFRCSKCRQRFGIPDRFQISRKYGWDFISFVFHQIIGLNIPQRVVVRNLNRLFGFTVNPSTVATLKTSVARYYSVTFKQILNRIAKGAVLHADETRANVQGTSAYVWVLCTREDVAYIYAETREDDLLHNYLADFTGVLVSDFYAAYDGMSCQKQKCLVHLVRQINDELMASPYNEELKSIAQAFAGLLKPIVDTVDRYGLKCCHLRKHKKSVQRFYEGLAACEFTTEAALKSKARFENWRDGLFTFLEHNDVPWNNNNAEHAIKAFARLRDVIAGSVTPTALEDYLVLLSICQTCEYRGLDFLDFLRSGEKDIEVFAQGRSRWKKSAPVKDAPADGTLGALPGES